ncbi:hypothetical protein M404DRAFT_1004881 [Pisolithus tinctorius Marx 270]|uniref:Uncharacterized protein n=1 Tax=Pisolithus tinctorius Marx 270 TaxID=870435 RepID=A0A0C3NUW2_PISTI|nr:hypothetical protein M404DRAFT_1004881 [Pisolithus tinctorius Marx 270]
MKIDGGCQVICSCSNYCTSCPSVNCVSALKLGASGDYSQLLIDKCLTVYAFLPPAW